MRAKPPIQLILLIAAAAVAALLAADPPDAGAQCRNWPTPIPNSTGCDVVFPVTVTGVVVTGDGTPTPVASAAVHGRSFLRASSATSGPDGNVSVPDCMVLNCGCLELVVEAPGYHTWRAEYPRRSLERQQRAYLLPFEARLVSTIVPVTETPTPTDTPSPTAGALPHTLYLPLLPNQRDVGDEIEAEEYAVYRALIQDWYYLGELEHLVIEDHTSNWALDIHDLEYLHERMPELLPSTAEGFTTRNEEQYPLADHFDVGTEIVLISEAEVEEIFSAGGWDEFYERYPNSQGIMGLSRVGFSPDGTQALLYQGNQMDYLAGAGHAILLAKVDGTWIVRLSVMLWIS